MNSAIEFAGADGCTIFASGRCAVRATGVGLAVDGYLLTERRLQAVPQQSRMQIEQAAGGDADDARDGIGGIGGEGGLREGNEGRDEQPH